MSNLEEEYLDVLQNIEAAIVSVYHNEPELLDFEVDKVLNALIRAYQAETQNRITSRPSFSARVEKLYNQVKAMCDWRLGREKPVTEAGEEVDLAPEPLAPDVIIACLKRLRKSVETWTKKGGRQGYLHYINQFL